MRARRKGANCLPRPCRLRRATRRPIYFSEFIVHADSSAQTLAQTFGGRLACMLPESNSGYNAPRHFLMRQAPAGSRTLYRPTARPTPTPLATIDAVIGGEAEVGVVDSYVLDLLRSYTPERMAELKTLAHTPAAPIPPLVRPHRLAPSRAPASVKRCWPWTATSRARS